MNTNNVQTNVGPEANNAPVVINKVGRPRNPDCLRKVRITPDGKLVGRGAPRVNSVARFAWIQRATKNSEFTLDKVVRFEEVVVPPRKVRTPKVTVVTPIVTPIAETPVTPVVETPVATPVAA